MLRISVHPIGRQKKMLGLSQKTRNYHKIQCNDLRLAKCSKTIRKEFLDYFVGLDHRLIPPSRVSPIFDSSLAFTNAGMNQFKGIFLDQLAPPYPRAVNHQKCVRVGGKHNDLKEVGMDSYHHTFFEMLGNWSFGDYGRKEACSYAWGLLTGPFGIPRDHLYVTYFSGDPSLSLSPDLETKETWLSLGLDPSHILPSGIQDNFWEMSLTGPCGPCTEIHVDPSPTSSRAPPPQSHLKELWNLVFIEHERLPDMSIRALDTRHVDTGMGFERLVAVLQGKTSNYDTDVFQPILEGIKASAGSGIPNYQGRFGPADEDGLDTAYRILADHARMLSACLADGMIPEENHKLRKVIRRAINVGIDVFRSEKILAEICPYVADTLGDAYPEIADNLRRIQTIVEYEGELLKALKKTSGKMWERMVEERPELGRISDPYASGLAQGYKELRKELKGGSRIPKELSFKMYDTYGLHPEIIEELAEVEGVEFDRREFQQMMEWARTRSRVGWRGPAVEEGGLGDLVPTDDRFKYGGSREIQAKVVGIIVDGELVGDTLTIDASLKGKDIGLVLNRTLFYTPEGGQLSDRGHLTFRNLSFSISQAEKIQGHVVHVGNFDVMNLEGGDNQLSVNDDVKLHLDGDYRASMMRHHTATHLLNCALGKLLPAVSQRGSVVKHDGLTLQVSAYGKVISNRDIKAIEKLINDCIQAQVPVTTKIVDTFQFNAERDLLLVPGTIYPEKNLRIVEIDGGDLRSKEACCGTHVENTKSLDYFRIIDVTSKGASSRAIRAVAGPQARNLPSEDVEPLTKKSCAVPDEPTKSMDPQKKREMVEDFLKIEMADALNSARDSFVVHCITLNSIEVESIPLQKIDEFCTDKPIFVIAKGKRKVRARCFVPETFISEKFDAELWMRSVNKILQSTIGHFDDDNSRLTSHTRILKLPRAEINSRVEKSLEEAKSFAVKNCKKL